MAVAFDVAASATNPGSASPTTATSASFTVNASATYALAVVSYSVNGGADTNFTAWTAVTLGGSSMSLVASSRKESGSDASTSGWIEMWSLASPPTGTGKTFSITATFTGGGTGSIIWGCCATFTGAINATPLGTPQRTNGQLVSSLSISDTLASGDLLFGGACNGSTVPTFSVGTRDATASTVAFSAAGFGAIAHNTGSGTVSLTAGLDATDWSALIGVKLVASGGGGGGAATPEPLIVPSYAVTNAASW